MKNKERTEEEEQQQQPSTLESTTSTSSTTAVEKPSSSSSAATNKSRKKKKKEEKNKSKDSETTATPSSPSNSNTSNKHKASSMEYDHNDNNNDDEETTFSSATRPVSKKSRRSRRGLATVTTLAQAIRKRQQLQKGNQNQSSEEEEETQQKEKQEEGPPAEEDSITSSLLTELLERLRLCHTDNNILPLDETRARNLLEASAGNLDLAVMLHWEDLAVSHCSSNPNEEENVDNDNNDNSGDGGSNIQQEAVDEVIQNYNAWSAASRRVVRFSQRHSRQEEGEGEQQEVEEEGQVEGAGEADANHLPEAERLVGERLAFAEAAAVDSNSVSISDDEGVANNASAAAFMIHLLDEEEEDRALTSQQNRLSTSSSSRSDTANANIVGAGGTQQWSEDFPFEHDVTDMHASPSDVLWGSSTIPETWLQCGFTLSSLGLIPSTTKPPTTTSRNKQYKVIHCPGVTAILSIVTALLQSNACIQGKSVNCSISRKRFSDLSSDEERRRFFHNRLADALSSLLHAAAKSKADVIARYKQKLKHNNDTTKLKSNEGQSRAEEEQALLKQQRRDFCQQQQLKLQSSICPVCTWQKESSSDNNNASPIGEAISTTKTNIHDLRAFVFSNIRTFTSKGGIALFLEIICRIHGTKRINAMLRKTLSSVSSLVNCSCNAITDNNNSSSHSCLSIEFLSLLLSTSIHTSLQGWNANTFGIGLLSSSSILSPATHTLDPVLLSPKKSVWIIMGDKYYSTIWLNQDDKDPSSNTSNNTAFHLTHWDCYKGVDTTMRIFPNAKVTNTNLLPPTDTTVSLDEVTSHAEDAKYYEEYIRWRFSFSKKTDTNSITTTSPTTTTTIAVPPVFKPYFQLSIKEKYLVDLKYSQKIQLVLWSKWDGAIVEDFSNGCPPVI